jgi:hypothetical protein
LKRILARISKIMAKISKILARILFHINILKKHVSHFEETKDAGGAET